MSKIEEKRLQRVEKLEEEMKHTAVATPEGYKRLFELVEKHGVKNAVYYFNTVEKRISGNVFKKEDIVFDQGLIFNNGLELRRIEKHFVNHFKKAGVEVMMKRERLPGYSL